MTYVLRPAVEAEESPVLAAHDAALRRQHDLVAAISDSFAHEALVVEGPVLICGIDQVDPELDGAVDRRDRLLVVARAVELRHTHAPETKSGNPQSLASQI